MFIFKLALLAGAGACLYVTGASWAAGYPPEIAITRGVVGFVAMTVLGFVGQVTVARGRATGPNVPAAADGAAPYLLPEEPESSV